MDYVAPAVRRRGGGPGGDRVGNGVERRQVGEMMLRSYPYGDVRTAFATVVSISLIGAALLQARAMAARPTFPQSCVRHWVVQTTGRQTDDPNGSG
jgi:hypothetical protein